MNTYLGLSLEKIPAKIEPPDVRLNRRLQPTFTDETLYESGIYDDRYRREQDARAAIAQGRMPLVGGGFTFVIDRRPPGQEGDYIPPDEYTRYFSNSQIPLAAPDHTLHDHDIGHVPGYQDMFANGLFANLVRAAAGNALATADGCISFTNAMDRLSDCLDDLSRSKWRSDVPNLALVETADDYLATLVALGGAQLHGQKPGMSDNKAVLATLQASLGLNTYRVRAAYRPYGNKGVEFSFDNRALINALQAYTSAAGNDGTVPPK